MVQAPNASKAPVSRREALFAFLGAGLGVAATTAYYKSKQAEWVLTASICADCLVWLHMVSWLQMVSWLLMFLVGVLFCYVTHS